jgi:hypothetical protein
MLGGNFVNEVVLDSIVTCKEGPARSAVRIGAPTELVAPAMRTLRIADGVVKKNKPVDGFKDAQKAAVLKSVLYIWHLAFTPFTSLARWKGATEAAWGVTAASQ